MQEAGWRSSWSRRGWRWTAGGIDLEALARHPAFSTESPGRSAGGWWDGWAGKGARAGAERPRGRSAGRGAGAVDVPPWQATRRGRPGLRAGVRVDMKGGPLLCPLRPPGSPGAGVVRRERALPERGGEEDGGLGTLAAVKRGHTGDAPSSGAHGVGGGPGAGGGAELPPHGPGPGGPRGAPPRGGEPPGPVPPHLAAMQGFEAERNRGWTTLSSPATRSPFPSASVRCAPGSGPPPWRNAGVRGAAGVAVHEEPTRVGRAFETLVEGVAERDPWLRGTRPSGGCGGGSSSLRRFLRIIPW